MASSPCRKKLRWRSTMALATRRMVSKRCWMFLMNQRASCRRCCSPAPWSPRWPRRALAYTSCTLSLGITSGLSCTLKPRPWAVTMTSGTTTCRSTSAKRRPGLGSSRAIRASAPRTSSSGRPHRLARRLTSRLAISSRGCSHTSRAVWASGVLRSSRICSLRHSARSRAPTPAGSMCCSQCRAVRRHCPQSSSRARASSGGRGRGRSRCSWASRAWASPSSGSSR